MLEGNTQLTHVPQSELINWALSAVLLLTRPLQLRVLSCGRRALSLLSVQASTGSRVM